MQVFKIHQMAWANAERTAVILVCDTDTGNNETVATPYSHESIIWSQISAFPEDSISEYVPPPPQESRPDITDVIPK